MITPLSKVLMVAAAVLMAVFGLWFRRRQERVALGGKISKPKVFWLSLAIYFWFAVCGIVGTSDAVDENVRRIFWWVALSMYARGAAEMFMLYVTHNWKPPYGIAHDVIVHVTIIVAWVLAFANGMQFSSLDFTSRAALLLSGVLFISLIFEIVHAKTFFDVVGKATLGQEAIWFADEHDPKFVAINRRTRIGNIVVSVPLLLFVVHWLVS